MKPWHGILAVGVCLYVGYLMYRRVRFGDRFNRSLGDSGLSAFVTGAVLIGLTMATSTKPPTALSIVALILISTVLAALCYWSVNDLIYYNKRRDAGLPDVDPDPNEQKIKKSPTWIGLIAAMTCLCLMFRAMATQGPGSHDTGLYVGLLGLSLRIDTYLARAKQWFVERSTRSATSESQT